MFFLDFIKILFYYNSHQHLKALAATTIWVIICMDVGFCSCIKSGEFTGNRTRELLYSSPYRH